MVVQALIQVGKHIYEQLDRGQNTMLRDLDQVLANGLCLSAGVLRWTMTVAIAVTSVRRIDGGLVLEVRSV